jgi:hypothetical protein
MKLKALKPEYPALGACIFILVFTLMLRPIIGVADNGDFPRIMGSTGLQYMSGDYEERYFGYVNRLYRVGLALPMGGGYFSTEIFMVGAAVLLSQAVLSTGVFDIRYLSLLYSVLFCSAIFLIIRCSRRRLGAAGWLLAGLLVFIFADIGYISYFNSLYGEAVSLVFLLLMAGSGMYLVLKDRPSLWMLAVFFTSAVFFTGAKIQNCPAGILAIFLGLRLLKLGEGRLWRRTAILGVSALIAVSLVSYVFVSRDIKVCNKYQTVFFGILKDSPDPAGDLAELGLDPDLAVLAGTNYFMQSYPVDIRSDDFKNRLYESVDHVKIAGFYLRHPDRFVNKLEIAAQNAFKLKQGFGNYEKYEGVAYRQTADMFGLWSDFKLKVLPHSLLFVALFYAGCFLILVFEYVRNRDTRNRLYLEIIAFIGATGLMQLVIPIIGDGEADLSKHLFLFNAAFDCMFIAAAVYLAHRLFRLANRVRAMRPGTS